MALPKGRHSKARSRSRLANWKLEKPPTMACPRCKQAKLPHHVCGNCGYYDGRQVVVMESDKKKKKAK
jgi:large subunit ribosomal protein L32